MTSSWGLLTSATGGAAGGVWPAVGDACRLVWLPGPRLAYECGQPDRGGGQVRGGTVVQLAGDSFWAVDCPAFEQLRPGAVIYLVTDAGPVRLVVTGNCCPLGADVVTFDTGGHDHVRAILRG